MNQNYMKLTVSHFVKIISRASPHCEEGLWHSAEAALCCAVIANYCSDVLNEVKNFGHSVGEWHPLVKSGMPGTTLSAYCKMIGVNPEFPISMLKSANIIEADA